MSSAAFRQLLEAGDVEGCRRAWKQAAPNMPQPATREEAEIVMHSARTQSDTVAFRHRSYSHAWLSERMLPSGLPDELKPKAERLHPRIAEAVGISVNFNSKYLRPAAKEIEGAMSDAVAECYADGHTDVAFVRERMKTAQERTLHALFGRR